MLISVAIGVPLGTKSGDICDKLAGKRYYLEEGKNALLYVKNLKKPDIKLRPPSRIIPPYMKTSSRRHK